MIVRPFFSFYGGKWRDTPRHYPAPMYGTIIEPFAGSAGYSVRHSNRRVILCDTDPVVVSVWRYLIGVSPSDIIGLPDVPAGGTVDDISVCEEARNLIGFWLNKGASSPRKRASKWMREGLRPGSFWGARVRARIASQLPLIRHWAVIHGNYTECPDVTATWFIDPPYEGRAGSHYVHGSDQIDYDLLGRWCQDRRGQVMVCEGTGAAWLPFQPLGMVKTARTKRAGEALWHSWHPARQMELEFGGTHGDRDSERG